jgi:hypothetical protein
MSWNIWAVVIQVNLVHWDAINSLHHISQSLVLLVNLRFCGVNTLPKTSNELVSVHLVRLQPFDLLLFFRHSCYDVLESLFHILFTKRMNELGDDNILDTKC